VRHALSVLGLDKVRNAVLTMSISRMLHTVGAPKNFSMTRFNRHSAAVALLADQLAEHARVQYPEGAFVAGLLHDVGRPLIAIALPDKYESILSAYQHSDRSWIECEMDIIGFTHAELSGDVLQAWKLPEEIVRAAATHHTPPAENQEGGLPLGRLVDAANQYVNWMGESVLEQRRSDGAGSAWVASLGLPPEVLDRVLANFKAEHDAMNQFFQ
jgi:putative nucleotidyltransferase with HDIG domain